MTLFERFEKGQINIGDYIDYKPVDNYCVLKTFETGAWSSEDEDQYCYTEGLKFQFGGVFKDKLILLSDDVTRQVVRFDGDVGFLNGSKLLQHVCESCWSNPTIGAVGFCLAFNTFYELPEEIKKTKNGNRCYWLASNGAAVGFMKNFSGLNFVDETKSHRYVGVSDMVNGSYSRFGLKRRGVEFAIRPAVMLPLEYSIDE